MLISSVSSTSATPLLNPAFLSKPKASTSVPSSTTANTPTSAAASSPAAPARSSGGHGGGGGGAAASAASELMSTSFSTTIAGKTYTGNVSESDGEYVASDPSLQGATASGSSTTDAENNLTVRIDELV